MMPQHVPAVAVGAIPPGSHLIDVREDDEWAAGHAPQATHLPMQEILARVEEIPTDRDVVVACRVGARSAQVTAYLVAQGWRNVVNLDGGMLAWQAAGLPLVSAPGAGPAQII